MWTRNGAIFTTADNPASVGNNQTVKILTAASTLTGSVSGSLTFTPAAAATVALGATGATTGVNFNVGGAIVIGTATAEGVYTGTMDVTVDYN